MKNLITFLLVFASLLSVNAQTCPYLTGAMINACGTEGSNEFVTFNTGSNPLAVNNLRFSYGTTANPAFTTGSVLFINGSTAGIYGTQPATITLTGCANINVMSAGQTIPANSEVVIMYTTTTTTTFNLAAQCVGGNAYVLFVVGANAAGFLTNGNFSNTNTRYMNITSSASPCSSANNGRSYSNSWASNADGNAVLWNTAGTASYSNNGCAAIAPLPIILANFSAKSKNDHVSLSWTTAMEQNNDYFEVEHSKDAITFESIEKVRGAVNSTENLDYSAEHRNLTEGIHYYRIRQVDTDGKTTLSEIKTVRFNAKTKLFWLMPSLNSTTLEVACDNSFDENTTMDVVNIMGQVLIQANGVKGTATQPIDVSNLVSGQYFLRIKSNQEQSILRFNR